jgi:hypothetical protein
VEVRVTWRFNSALDRAGVTEPNQVEVTVRPFEELLGDVTGGNRADYRRSGTMAVSVARLKAASASRIAVIVYSSIMNGKEPEMSRVYRAPCAMNTVDP